MFYIYTYKSLLAWVHCHLKPITCLKTVTCLMLLTLKHDFSEDGRIFGRSAAVPAAVGELMLTLLHSYFGTFDDAHHDVRMRSAEVSLPAQQSGNIIAYNPGVHQGQRLNWELTHVPDTEKLENIVISDFIVIIFSKFILTHADITHTCTLKCNK